MIAARVLFRRVATVRAVAARCLASSGTKPGDVALGPEAELPKSGYYSPQSIDRRVAMGSRPRGESGVGRTTPPLSEEDHWHLAGAPGYDQHAEAGKVADIKSMPTDNQPSGLASLPTNSESGSNSSPPISPTNTNAEFPLFSKDPNTFPYVRISHSTVQASKLPAFLRTYQLSVTPAYLSSPGLSSLQLLIGDVPVDAAPADIALACFNHGNATNTVPVVSITTWLNEVSWRRGVERSEYTAAMQTIAPYLSKATPVGSNTKDTGAGVHTVEYRAVVTAQASVGGQKEGNPGEYESVVGSELGLR
jgi:hypothetical protein